MKSEYKVLLFNDIKSSSKLWKLYNDDMYLALKTCIKLTKSLLSKYNGVFIKLVGDSFNVSFNTIKEAIQFTLEFNIKLINKPIYLGKNNTDKIEFRSGICYGQVKKLTFNFNNCDIIDYFGNIANTASRMESKVSLVNGLAIGVLNYNQHEIDDIIDIISNKKYNKYWDYEMKYYTDKCNINRYKRSMKLLHDISIKCEDIEKLKGVDKIYTINLIPKFK